MKKYLSRFLIVCSLPAFFSSEAHARKSTFLEKDGMVVIEAESSSTLGRWKKRTTIKGFTGECHLEFTGNSYESGPPKSTLRYKFQITKPGNYTLVLRAHKRLISKRDDICNDCYVKMRGDFTAGGKAPMKILKKDTKLFGGSDKGWGYANLLDENHKKMPAVYNFKEGEEYTLEISGRSKNFNLDRFLLVHEDHKMKKILRDLAAFEVSEKK